MTSMLDIVAEATSAATKGWKRARQAAFGASAETGAVPTGTDQLARLIEADIMPRLMSGYGQAAPGASLVPADQVRRFAHALLGEELGPLLDEVDQLTAAGHEPQALMHGLIAPAVRLLGDWWLADDIDFVDVTMGGWRCQQLVHALGAQVPGRAPLPGSVRRALILPAPGEQHVLGAMMVEDAFRRAGWDTRGGPALDEDALIALAAREAFDVIGLSVSCAQRLPVLARTLALLRRVALQPPLLLLGGPALADGADAALLGADAIASSVEMALQLAERRLAPHAATGNSLGR
ncbi:cobalamin B12-binding domain-containing protein [Sandarakinorhabdus oryzae]|uniref:cobalamin B12-binding domain-containing protein n=1 Tax=Sandarakinorhabdus oryzae TaxID=2675220 RepID=UPI0018CC149D|nr:cobalamin B12-binding domain-containing protein [Sandarakinorhabdus oryzae]